MKLSILIFSTLLFLPLPVSARNRNVFIESFCYKNVEKYIPGYVNTNGRYVSGYLKKTRKRVPCYKLHGHRKRNTNNKIHGNIIYQNPRNNDNNSCVEGSILGGIAGGGLGAALSRKEGRWWSIPLGVVGGSMIGCQVDGG